MNEALALQVHEIKSIIKQKAILVLPEPLQIFKARCGESTGGSAKAMKVSPLLALFHQSSIELCDFAVRIAYFFPYFFRIN
jgi:hypothetical protein